MNKQPLRDEMAVLEQEFFAKGGEIHRASSTKKGKLSKTTKHQGIARPYQRNK